MDWSMLLQLWLYGVGFFTVIGIIHSFIHVKYNKCLVRIDGTMLELLRWSTESLRKDLEQGFWSKISTIISLLFSSMFLSLLWPVAIKTNLSDLLRLLNMDFKEIK